MPEVVLSQRARKDLIDIARFTAEKWGRAQRDLYMGAIASRLHQVARRQGQDRRYRGLDDPAFAVRIWRHMAFYDRIPGGIFVVAVLHQNMNIPKRAMRDRPRDVE